MTRRLLLTLAIFVASMATSIHAARAADVTKPVADGVTMLTRTTSSPALVIHALTADLTKPGVHLGSTTSAERKKTTSSYAKLNATTAAAVNGDLFSYATYGTTGLAAGNGVAWTDTKDNSSSANIAFDNASHVELYDMAKVVAFDATWMKGVVSGHPQLVNGGVLLATNPASPACPTRNPRTAVGLSQDKKKVFVVVVDGRSTASVGMTCTELATLMKSLGAFDAINLDGGGSTTMYLRGTGIVNKPSDGSERIVANHLAIHAPKLGSVGSVSGKVFASPDKTKLLDGAKVSITGATVTAGAADVTDATGVYSLDSVPGTFTLKAMKPGYAPQSVPVTIGTGADVKLDIGLLADPNADFDSDGIVDSKDVCPEVADPDQRDTDKDGKGDACDGDDDNDGLADEDDACPLVAGEVCPDASAASSSSSDASAEPTSPTANAAATDGSNDNAGAGEGCALSHSSNRFNATAMIATTLLLLLRLRRRQQRRRAPNDASSV